MKQQCALKINNWVCVETIKHPPKTKRSVMSFWCPFYMVKKGTETKHKPLQTSQMVQEFFPLVFLRKCFQKAALAAQRRSCFEDSRERKTQSSKRKNGSLLPTFAHCCQKKWESKPCPLIPSAHSKSSKAHGFARSSKKTLPAFQPAHIDVGLLRLHHLP